MAFSFRNFFGVDDEFADGPEDDYQAPTEPQMNAGTPKRPMRQNVVSMDERRAGVTESNSKIALFEPRIYSDVKEIANQLMANQAIIVNFSSIEDSQAKRIVDFLTGTVYAIDGEIERIGDAIFLVTPHNYEISGSVSTSINSDISEYAK
ncbi:DUF552 domain-containing protein [Periweissella cryptocerci]|uniref:Cell division protein SepF n=1 Tax=Periweissella cryptocerci TaxID=2506420 RepID=A0A4P6YVT8_9LACO|nr:cell division protein SepF [Periweissella cryptocerci]QBO36891.1 DUF552 domain-containing protein [Periweissella cryptocerci]